MKPTVTLTCGHTMYESVFDNRVCLLRQRLIDNGVVVESVSFIEESDVKFVMGPNPPALGIREALGDYKHTIKDNELHVNFHYNLKAN